MHMKAPALLQIAERARTGSSLLRPLWSTVLWVIIELPARLEAMLPPPLLVPYPAHKPVPAEPDGSAQFDHALSATTNSSSRAISTPAAAAHGAEAISGLLNNTAVS